MKTKSWVGNSREPTPVWFRNGDVNKACFYVIVGPFWDNFEVVWGHFGVIVGSC